MIMMKTQVGCMSEFMPVMQKIGTECLLVEVVRLPKYGSYILA